jgi:hypothetical protein
MLMLSSSAVAAIEALCRRYGCEPTARVRSVASGARAPVTIEPGGEPAAGDVTVSRDGVTVLDRELAAAASTNPAVPWPSTGSACRTLSASTTSPTANCCDPAPRPTQTPQVAATADDGDHMNHPGMSGELRAFQTRRGSSVSVKPRDLTS